MGDGNMEYASPNERQIVTSILMLGKLLSCIYPEYTQHKSSTSTERAVKKDANWFWPEKCHKAFEEQNKMLISDMSLTHFNLKLEMILATDASEYRLGAVIIHKCKDDSQKSIVHASRTLLPTEKKQLIEKLKEGHW